jgi:predicted nucleic acid-binding protein
MAMTRVIDASVAMRWLARGRESEKVDQIFDDAIGNGGDQLLIAPSLILLEVHHALAKLWNRELVALPQFAEAQVLLGLAIQIEPVDEGLAREAGVLSMSAETAIGRPVTARTLPFNIYDCTYIALALRWSAELTTADERQAMIAEALGCRVRRFS